MAGLRRTFCFLIALALTATAATASAQDWSGPLEGLAAAVCGDRPKSGVMVITPGQDEPTQQLESRVKQVLGGDACIELVMDDAPLGDLTGKSDTDAIAEGRNYPVDAIVLLRVYPGSGEPTAVVRIEHRPSQATQSHRFQPSSDPPWSAEAAQPAVTTPPPQPSGPDPNVVAATKAQEVARSEASVVRAGAVGVATSSKLVLAENERRVLTFEPHKRSPVVRDLGGDAVPWPHAYELMGEPTLAAKYRNRRRIRGGALAAGLVLSAAGAGLLFVALTNQTNCSGGSGQTCSRPAFIGVGAGALGVGVGLLIVSSRVAPQPIGVDQIRKLVDAYNDGLQR